uniref:Rad60-SLD domain-containing protein n=1 Tax=Macrostomum lignano TaxID=282301 RepID=A0A1I8GTC6_9PLAT
PRIGRRANRLSGYKRSEIQAGPINGSPRSAAQIGCKIYHCGVTLNRRHCRYRRHCSSVGTLRSAGCSAQAPAEMTQTRLKEGILNLDDEILKYARSVYDRLERKDLEKSLHCSLPWEELRHEIDTRELLMHTAVPNYATDTTGDAAGSSVDDAAAQLQSDEVPLVTSSQPLNPSTSHSCVFRTVYTNACPHEVVNTINTTRTTRASCSFRISRALMLKRELGLKLALPKDILEFNVGFSSEFTMEQEAQKTVENEITWSVNTEVRVPGAASAKQPSRVTAEIVIEEKEFKAKFTAVTHLSGRIKVRLFSKDGRSLTTVAVPNIRKVFTEELGFVHPREAAAVS